MRPPLAGFRARAAGRSEATGYGLDLLLGLGAELEAAPASGGRALGPQVTADAGLSIGGAGRRTGARLEPLDARLAELAAAGLPPGVTELALGRALATAALAGWLAGRNIEVDPLAVLMQLHLPAVMAASYGSPWWPRPPAPRPAAGGGWLNADLGAPGDAETFARLLETMGPDATAAAIAEEAQTWRLPVCDYRARSRRGPPPWRPAPSGHPAPPGRAAGRDGAEGAAGRDRNDGPGGGLTAAVDQPGRPALEGITVCDLTAIWAGPLATWMLVQLGAEVVKVEPPSRPDGTRALSGRGIWPGGRSRGPAGEDSAIFNALNAGKRSVRLDATTDAPALRQLAASADVVIDSFSPRVMPQLGLDRAGLGLDRPDRRQPGTVTVSMPAFPPGPMRDRIAYGNGIHALSGLGGGGGGPDGAGPDVPASSYPDPLAGLEAAATVMAALAGRKVGWIPHHLEVSLAGTVEPLLQSPPAPWAGGREDVGGRLLAAGRVSGSVTARRDGAGIHLYPTGPFGKERGWAGAAP